MGSTVSVSSGDVHCSAINDAKTFFNNTVILSKFWEEVLRCSRASEGVGEGANSSGEQASLMSLLQLLSSTDYGNVVMYASPFLGPFATSRFCLRQAFYTSTGRVGGMNLSDMFVNEEEMPSLLKHLFFFHRIYALFDQTFEFDSELSMSRYIEILQDFNEQVLRTDEAEGNYTVLGENHNGIVSYSIFVKHMVETIFPTTTIFPHDICEALIHKSLDEIKLNESILSKGSLPVANSDDLILSVSWYTVAHYDDWMRTIEMLGNNAFKSLLNQIKCERCCFCASISDPSVILTFLWMRPEGEVLYEAFLREQLTDGGIFKTAREEGVITSSIEEFQVNSNVSAWRQPILRTDVMNVIQFEVKDVTGFVSKYSLSDNGSRPAQVDIGKCSALRPGQQGALVEHYTSQGWKDERGSEQVRSIENRLMENDDSLACVRNFQGVVLASFDDGKWITEDA